MSESNQSALPKLLTTEDVANILGISPATLEKARSTGLGDFPPYIKIGRTVRYLEEVVGQWMKNRIAYRSTFERVE